MFSASPNWPKPAGPPRALRTAALLLNHEMDAPNAPIPRTPLSCRVRPVQPGHAPHNLEIAPIGVCTHIQGSCRDKQRVLSVCRLHSGTMETVNKLHALVVYVPRSHTERVLAAIGDAGAGRIGNYSHCSFVMSGTGRFTPLEGSEPYLGQVGKPEEAAEDKIECVVDQALLGAVVAALRAAHPYEEPAFMSWPVEGWR